MNTPAQLIANLEQIERDLANRMPSYEDAAAEWYKAKRDKEEQYAIAFRTAKVGGATDGAAKAAAEIASAQIGAEHESVFEARKAAIKVLDTRATINQSLLNAAKIGLNQ